MAGSLRANAQPETIKKSWKQKEKKWDAGKSGPAAPPDKQKKKNKLGRSSFYRGEMAITLFYRVAFVFSL